MESVPRLSMQAVRQRRRDEERAYFNIQRGVTRCMLCRWKFRGPFGAGRELYLRHREEKH